MKSRRYTQSEKFLDVKIERMVPDGYGIGFAEGLTVFVPLTAAGDKVKVRIDKQKGKVVFASLVKVLEPSPDRIAPPCPYFGRCGGCDFQQMNYKTQLAAKVGIVKDCLRRIGKIDWQNEIEIVPSPQEWAYRTRVQWKRDGQKLGYFERNSHRVCDVEVCPILSTPLQNELTAWREKVKSKYVNFAEIQTVSSNDAVSWRFGDENENLDENFYAANREAEKEEITINASDNADALVISLKIGEFDYSFSAASFFQVNHEILPQVVENAIGDGTGNFALDLYCGVGLFTLPLLKRFSKTIGVEGNYASIGFAQQNAEKAGFNNVTFETAWVGDWLKQNAASLPEIDLVLLDPPRTGAERETVESLISLKPQKIVYVSCKPATLARDLKMLIESGNFRIEKITAFDFFPQTHHVETIVHLRRTD